MPPRPWVYHTTYGTIVASEKFELTAEELCHANTFQFRIDSDDDFSQDLVRLTSKAQDKQDLLRMLADRKRDRVADLDHLLEEAIGAITANPWFMRESRQWHSATSLFREQSLSRLLHFMQSFAPDEYTKQAEEWYDELRRRTRDSYSQN